MAALNMNEGTMQDDKRTFLIPSPNLATFQARFDKLVKRAKRIGCTVPSYTVVAETPKTINVVVGEEVDFFGRTKQTTEERTILVSHIVFNSSKVVVAGFSFLCTIEHTTEGNILHTARNTAGVVPHKYRTVGPFCDHCKTERNRRDTFVVMNETNGADLQVGRNCLAAFLGQDAERYAAEAELFWELDETAEACEEEGSGGWGSSGPRYDRLDSYLGYAAEAIIRYGWKSRTVAREYGGLATADLAYRHMHPTREERRDLEWTSPTDAAKELAAKALTWCCEIADSETDASDYLYNTRTIARRGLVGQKGYGLAASIVSGYQKYVGTLIRKQRFADRASVSRFVGSVGEKRHFSLLIEKVIPCDTMYGMSFCHLMVDPTGCRFVWFSSSTKLEENTDVVLKGTIKEHKVREGVEQTILTRCEKVVIRTYTAMIGTTTYDIPAESEKEAGRMLRETLGVAKLPKGTRLTEKVVEIPMVQEGV